MITEFILLTFRLKEHILPYELKSKFYAYMNN